MKILKNSFLFVVLLSSTIILGQEGKNVKPTVNWNIRGQIWLRYSDLNEGSLINNELTNSFADVSIRRLRIPISSQITPNVFLYSILGGNNYNFRTKEFP